MCVKTQSFTCYNLNDKEASVGRVNETAKQLRKFTWTKATMSTPNLIRENTSAYRLENIFREKEVQQMFFQSLKCWSNQGKKYILLLRKNKDKVFSYVFICSEQLGVNFLCLNSSWSYAKNIYNIYLLQKKAGAYTVYILKWAVFDRYNRVHSWVLKHSFSDSDSSVQISSWSISWCYWSGDAITVGSTFG